MDKTKPDFNAVWGEIAPIMINNVRRSFPDDKELLDNLPGMFQFISKVRLTQETAAQKLGFDFLVEAERDIASCRVLYARKLYPHSVYHFQQAVEKATKGYMLGFNFLSIQELKTHDTPELFLDALFEKTGIESWAKHLIDKSLETKLGKAREAISRPDKRQEIARTPYDTITADLSLIPAFTKKGKPIIESLFKQLSSIVGVEPPPILQAMTALVVLFILAVVSFPHVEYTRYPDKEIVPSDYEASFGIVRTIPRMIKCLEPEIRRLKALLEVNKCEVIEKQP